MTRSFVRIVGEERSTLCQTVTAAILLSTLAGAHPQKSSLQQTGSGGGGSAPESLSVDLSPKNKLVFPYGVQRFERRENIKVGNDVTVIPGWHFQGAAGLVTAIVDENLGISRPGTKSKAWLKVDDFGAGSLDGFTTPPIQAPSAWNYAWTFGLNVTAIPGAADAPVLAVQHSSGGNFGDAWGVRITPTGAELYTTDLWGNPGVVPLYVFSGPTDVGEWVDLRVVASLTYRTLTAYVNGSEVGMIRTRPAEATDVTRLRFAYHGNGLGNPGSLLIDDIGVQFLSGECTEELMVDFTTQDDAESALLDGQAISNPPEFGAKLTFNGSGPNNGAAIFDSSVGGPNDPSQDTDLLVDQGNILILQNDTAPPAVGDIYPNPNDDQEGGNFAITFNRPTCPLSIDLIDIDNSAGLANTVTITLTDFSGDTRTYTVPADWTGDITEAQPGVGTLDLQTLANQPGPNGPDATAVEDAGFDPNAVMSMSVDMGSSGALDNLHVVIPCVQFTFETEDDGTPDTAGTPLVNGQDLSTPDEFAVEAAIADAGFNAGAAIFESTPGGDNDPGPDLDLLVGLGNIVILQSDNAPAHTTQTVPGIFDTPNDDVNGGSVAFIFPSSVTAHEVDLIDVDEEEAVGVFVTLIDSIGNTRIYSCPPSWTEDRLNDGPPAFRTLDLTTLANQPGFAATATAVEDPGFDPDDVISCTMGFGGAQACDNLCFCP